MYIVGQLALNQGNLVLQILEVVSIEWLQGLTRLWIIKSIFICLFVVLAGTCILEGVPLIGKGGALWVDGLTRPRPPLQLCQYLRACKIVVTHLRGILELFHQWHRLVWLLVFILLQLIMLSGKQFRVFLGAIEIGRHLYVAIRCWGCGFNLPARQIFLVERRSHIWHLVWIKIGVRSRIDYRCRCWLIDIRIWWLYLMLKWLLLDVLHSIPTLYILNHSLPLPSFVLFLHLLWVFHYTNDRFVKIQ